MCLFPTCMYTVYTPYRCTAATIPVVLLIFGTPEQSKKHASTNHLGILNDTNIILGWIPSAYRMIYQSSGEPGSQDPLWDSAWEDWSMMVLVPWRTISSHILWLSSLCNVCWNQALKSMPRGAVSACISYHSTFDHRNNKCPGTHVCWFNSITSTKWMNKDHAYQCLSANDDQIAPCTNFYHWHQ